MNDKVLTYILIGLVVMFVIALSIYFFPIIKKLIPKKKKKSKKKKSKDEPKPEKIKRPVLLTPQESKEEKKFQPVQKEDNAFGKKEPAKSENDLVMDFPPLVTQPQQKKDNRTVVSNNRGLGSEFDEIKNYLQETEEDIFTSVGRKALSDSQAKRPVVPPPRRPSTTSNYNDMSSFIAPPTPKTTQSTVKQGYPNFLTNTESLNFNYSKPKEYTPGKSVLDLGQDEKDIIKQFKNLSPEMKKLLISDVLSKKRSDDF